jgi:heme iron utilization protein
MPVTGLSRLARKDGPGGFPRGNSRSGSTKADHRWLRMLMTHPGGSKFHSRDFQGGHMDEIAEVWAIVRELLESQRLAVLSTQSQVQPYSNLVAFAATPDLKYLIFATTRDTRKYANLLNHAQVSILIDNRTNETADFAEAAAVTVLGRASEVHGDERRQHLKIYLNRHPYLEDFVTSPNCALFTVKVERYIMVTRFQDVREIVPGP